MAKKAKKTKKSLVIVESPAKSKTLNKILGSKYIVKACMGHVRDLPKTSLGIKLEEEFKPSYRVIKGKTAIIKELKAAAKGIEFLYLATDPDREGEAIAWHLAQTLGVNEDKIRRVAFNEITKRAVKEAFENPSTVSLEKVNAQQARRLLDRIVGYKLSPLLWKKIGKGLSAGRVQSVAVRLVVDKEKEIQAFKQEEYWSIEAELKSQKEASEIFTAELKKIGGKDIEIGNDKDANAVVDRLKKEPFIITSVVQKEKKENPSAPYITSTLQQQASTHLRFSTRKTMRVAQQLYEGVDIGSEGSVGLITYMRTDSFRIADEAMTECRETVVQLYGKDYLIPETRIYTSKKGSQDAHEAIRPTSASRTPEMMAASLSEDQLKLYRLIWERFIVTQMKPSVFLDTTVQIQADDGLFQTKGRELRFDGYSKVSTFGHKKEIQMLPPLTEGENLNIEQLTPTQHFTQPPPRFSEASLVRALESYSIGRPSTYAPIISTIQDRGYVRQEKRRLFATELGIIVTDKLVGHFDDIMNTDFTAKMEERLDQVEEAKAEWTTVLKDFYEAFVADLDRASEEMVGVKDMTPESGEMCPECEKPLLIRWNKFGKFLGCSGFPDCKHTKSIDVPAETGENCEKCGKEMVIKASRRGRFMACSGYPDCKNTRSLAGGVANKIKVPDGFSMECDQCGTEMVVRYGRRGPFIACPKFPECKNTKSIPPEWRKKKGSDTEAISEEKKNESGVSE